MVNEEIKNHLSNLLLSLALGFLVFTLVLNFGTESKYYNFVESRPISSLVIFSVIIGIGVLIADHFTDDETKSGDDEMSNLQEEV